MSFYKFGDYFKWFVARVSDIKDPEYLGRVKIRVLHNQTGELGKVKKNKGIHNDDLLWAWPLSSVQSASLSWVKLTEKNVGLEEFDTPDWINAVGLSPTGIAKGTYVFGFYLDGQEQNIPIIFGTYHKQSILPEPPSDDPNENSLLQLKPPADPEFYSDVAALARGEEGSGGQTLPKEPYTKADALTVTSEPKSAYKTEYPYNTTYTTKSGHAIELDDTVGHERIHIWHKSGSYEEIANGPPESGKKYTGRRVKKTTDSDYEIVLKDKNSLVKQNYNREISNTENTDIGLDNNITIGNNLTKSVGNNSTIAISNNSTTTVGKNVDVTIGEDGTIIIGGHLRITAEGGVSIGSPGGITLTEGTLSVRDSVGVQSSATGSFTTPTGQTVDVINGIIVNIK